MKLLTTLTAAAFTASGAEKLYFPPPGESLEQQSRRPAEQAGFLPGVVAALDQAKVAERWALWRHGHLIHVKGDFNEKSDVASNRKTWHALTVGAAIQQGKIPSVRQKISVWNKELKGKDAEATWWHVITQSAGFDYPYGEYPDFAPGKMWTYSDYNPVNLCRALARVYGRGDYTVAYDGVLREAYFDAIGMRGWETILKKDRNFAGPNDGVRLMLDLEDMGRLGLLVLARGRWSGRQLVPESFVRELEKKQTRGMLVNYNGPNDGTIARDSKKSPEAPYGYMTWVNTDGDLLPGADRAWAYASGAGGHLTMWNYNLGIVFAAAAARQPEHGRGIAHIIEAHLPGSERGKAAR
jgi:CubicO group peptidase (beta-lactamase class C family)